VAFQYDPFGRRIQETATVGSTNAVYVLDGADVLEEVNSTGTTVNARYTMGPGIDQPLAELRGTTTSFYEADGLGSITSLTNSSSAIANTYTYDSFGKQTASTGTVVNNFRYTAREQDSETGLMYYRARYYDPNNGRFVTEDPLRLKGGINYFDYVLNNPVNLEDQFGLLPRPTPVRWRYCTGGEVSYCRQDCASRGKQYESCRVRQIYKIGPNGLSVGPEWLNGQISCSCKDPEECQKAHAADPKAVKDVITGFKIGVLVGVGILAPEFLPEAIPELAPAWRLVWRLVQ
jgi:RHS repeat-associated protein